MALCRVAPHTIQTGTLHRASSLRIHPPACPIFGCWEPLASNDHIKYTVIGPITSCCSRSWQFAAGIKIAVIGMSALEDTGRTQGL